MDPYPTLLKALGDETRYRMVQLLLGSDLCVGALARRLGISDAAVSQHLQLLRRLGLVRGEKRGYWTHYSVDRERLRQIAKVIADMADRGPLPEDGCLRMPFVWGDPKERRDKEMCKDCCEHPDKLKGTPQECTPEQIKECHGDVKEHPCVESSQKE